MIIFDSLICKTLDGGTYSYLDGVLTYRYTPTSTNYYIQGTLTLNVNGNQIAINSVNHGKPSSTSQQVDVQVLNENQLNTIYGHLPNSIVATLRLTLSEYSDSAYSNKVGSSVYQEIKLTIPENVKPKINFTNISLVPSEITVYNPYTDTHDTYKYLIKGKTNLLLSVSGVYAGNGSNIKSYTFTGPSVSQTSTSPSISVPAVTNVHEFVDGRATITYTVTVTDSRNRSASAEKDITCYDYHNPYFSSFKVSREENGTVLKCTYTPVFAPITNIFNNSINRADVQIYYISGNTEHYKTIKQVSNGIEASATIELDNSSSTYQVYAIIIDELNETGRTATKTIYGDSRVINVFPDGTGVAFGKKADEKELLDSRWPIRANGFFIPEIQHGSVSITPVANEATSVNITFGSLFSGVPTVIVTPQTKEPGSSVLGVGVANINQSGFEIWLTRTNNTPTTVNWVAMY